MKKNSYRSKENNLMCVNATRSVMPTDSKADGSGEKRCVNANNYR